jgi:hydrophobic/amphiphilic exporter-1 (mainly G- bacteria), HAE1 family
MTLIEIATSRRVTISMLFVAIAMFGMVSLSRLNLNLLPDLSYPTITVRAELTGAAPVEIENLLTKPIEEAVGVIKNVRVVRSVSRSGQSDVIIEFAWGTNMDLAAVEVREKIDLLVLPLDASRPLLLRFDPSSEPIMRLGLRHSETEAGAIPVLDEEALKALRRFAEERLKTDLESVDGTAAVKVSGGLEDEIQVLVDEERLAQLGLSIELVAQRLSQENVNLSGGRLEQGAQRYLVRTLNEFIDWEEIEDVIISSPQGRPIYLRDVATVTRGYRDRVAITRMDGFETVELAVYREGDANTVQVATDLRARLEEVRQRLPEGTEIAVIYDQSQFISGAISEVKQAAMFGGLLAVLVLYLFLRDSRPTIIIGLTIPASVIGTFMLMYLSDLTLNIMSLGGIALAIGMLVDNSIVVLENIARKREEGLSILEASRAGTTEVSTAVTASTLTTIAVFFPMVFVTGLAGQLFRDQALTVTYALLFSLAVALTLIPMLASLGGSKQFSDAEDDTPPGYFTRGIAFVVRMIGGLFRLTGHGLRFALLPLVWVFQVGYQGLAKAYAPMLGWSLRNRLVVVAAAAALFGGTMSLIPQLGAELIPQLAQGEFQVELSLAAGTPLAVTDQAVRRLQGVAEGIEEIELTYSVAGTGNRLDANPVDAGEHTGTMSVVMAAGTDESDELRVRSVLRRALAQIPGLEFEFRRPELFTLDTPLQIEVTGYDLDQIADVNESIVNEMQASDRFTDITTTVETGNPEIQVIFDQERAAQLGLVVRDIADVVVANIRGTLATRYSWRDRKIDVTVRGMDTRAASIEEVRDLIINPTSARPIPLEAVADVIVSSGPSEIRRIDQERVAIIAASLGYGDLGSAAAEVQQIINSTPMPAGISAQITGQNEEMQESFRSMQFTLAMAVFLVYLVMASQFESLLHPFVIMFTIPLALVGAVLALYITGTSVNVVAFIGVIMLAGIVVNNAIVLIDLINQLRERGMERIAAIQEAGKHRLRPILMTTLTTVLGLMPMALGLGEGSEVRTPMAITVIGGLLVSTLLTLIVIPVVYSLIDRSRTAADIGVSRA